MHAPRTVTLPPPLTPGWKKVWFQVLPPSWVQWMRAPGTELGFSASPTAQHLRYTTWCGTEGERGTKATHILGNMARRKHSRARGVRGGQACGMLRGVRTPCVVSRMPPSVHQDAPVGVVWLAVDGVEEELVRYVEYGLIEGKRGFGLCVGAREGGITTQSTGTILGGRGEVRQPRYFISTQHATPPHATPHPSSTSRPRRSSWRSPR